MAKFIWLIGENLSTTYDNNSYYFWDHNVLKDDEIEKYYVLDKNEDTIKFYNSLEEGKKKFIIWRNTFKHFEYFKKADMYFVTLSYRDILPEYLAGRKIKLIIKRPLIYLQHGTLAIKKIGYKGTTYYNNLFRFVYYNKDIKEKLIEENDFKDYQLHYGEFHPRYKKMVEIYLEDQKQKHDKKKILFFITWREYFGDNFETKKFINKFKRVIDNPDLLDYINNNDVEVEICLHQFFDDEKIAEMKENLDGNEKIKVVHPGEIDVMHELATCDLLITDYSSVGFECTLLNKPVILFEPDQLEYFAKRETYYTVEEISKYSIRKVEDLVDTIVNGKYTVNDFFRSKLPKKIDYNYLLQGKHIDKMYNYYHDLQVNRITILGYNFTGKGGTVTSTKALSEALLEDGYLVELLSLKMTEKKYSLPYGLAINGFYNRTQNKWISRAKRHLFKSEKDYYYFNYDLNKKMLFPYIGRALKHYLENTSSRTIISTRESIHLFVKYFANKNVVNKIYFFHTDSTILNDYYPNLIDEIKKTTLENCVFVTEASKQAYKENLGFDNYENGVVIGNSLTSNSMIEKKNIKINKEEPGIKAVTLMRLSADREPDIENIISFGKYVLEQKIDNLMVLIYGMGDLAEPLKNRILEEGLDDILFYKGATNNSKGVILNSDCVIDFCNNQSFGMTYIEGILNGKPVFAKENVGSLEVLKDIPYSYYHSDEELLEKVMNVKKKSVSEYKKNYDLINKRYSRKIVAKKIEELLK